MEKENRDEGPSTGTGDVMDVAPHSQKRPPSGAELLGTVSRVFRNSVEGICVTDTDGVIQMVNPAFTRITGYRAEEAIGKSPRILKSDHHDSKFYEQMWHELLSVGQWSGEIWNRRKDGEAYPEWLNISSIQDDRGKKTHYVGIFHDITEMKKTEEVIKYQAYHDALTALPNRMLFLDRLEVALHHAQRQDQKVAVFFLDLDHFKTVNDSLGHAIGDKLLQEVAKRLLQTVREEDTVSRLGGDEFTIILPDVAVPKEIAVVASRIVNEIRRPFVIEGQEIVIGASIGISMFPMDGSDAGALVKNADTAMYRAKREGRRNFQFFTRSLEEGALSRIDLEAELRRGLQRNEFQLHYQPKLDLKTGKITGMEALIRWTLPDGGVIEPERFLPVAEETGLIIPLGEFVLNQASSQLKRWVEAGYPHLTMAVNLSSRQFWLDNLPRVMKNIVDRYGISPAQIELHIPENLLMKNAEKTIVTLQGLKGAGFRITLDNFGNGCISLYSLRGLPVDCLQIDRSLLKAIPGDPANVAVAQAIILLGRSLNLDIIAEGVETAGQIDFLKRGGCRFVQGNFISPPLRGADVASFLASVDPAFKSRERAS